MNYIIIRNDDPCALSNVAHERRILSLFERHRIKQVVCVIPRVVEDFHNHRLSAFHPLEENQPLVELLKEYQQKGTVCDIALPAGLQLAQKLPQPLFTPSSKAAVGEHDENISIAQVEALIGRDMAGQVAKVAIQLYTEAAEYALTKGIIIADTKFEFGLDNNGVLHVMDEVLTPDSSRFWPAETYKVGSNPPSYDKQFVRDWLESIHWNKAPPAPALPDEVAQRTSEKYMEAFEKLTGRQLLV